MHLTRKIGKKAFFLLTFKIMEHNSFLDVILYRRGA